MAEKQIALAIPDWVKGLKDDDISGAIVGLLFSWAWDGEAKEIPNLREYIASKYDDMTDTQIEEIANLLVEHKVVK